MALHSAVHAGSFFAGTAVDQPGSPAVHNAPGEESTLIDGATPTLKHTYGDWTVQCRIVKGHKGDLGFGSSDRRTRTDMIASADSEFASSTSSAEPARRAKSRTVLTIVAIG